MCSSFFFSFFPFKVSIKVIWAQGGIDGSELIIASVNTGFGATAPLHYLPGNWAREY